MKDMENKEKKKVDWSAVWPEAKELVWRHRKRMVAGLILLLVSRSAGMVLPASTKFLIDDVIGQGRADLLKWIALAAIGATVINATTSFSLTVLLGVAAQRAIADMRRRVQEHIGRLPVRYYDEPQERRADLAHHDATPRACGTSSAPGFVQMVGGLFTAVVAALFSSG